MMRKKLLASVVAAALVFVPEAAFAVGTSAWVAGNGQGLTYGTAGFTAANFNSLATGSVVLAASAISNVAPLDIYADVSFSLVVGATTTTVSYLALYIMPLNADGTTYGDGTGSGTTAPTATYLASTAQVVSGVTTGNAIQGTFRGVILPPGSFKFAIVSQLGITLNSAAAAVVDYRTYNENLNR